MEIHKFNSDIGSQFRQVVKGNNFMTPEIYGYVRIKDGIAEISTGPKFLGTEMWGITVVQNGIKNNDLSNCVNSFVEVTQYLTTLL